MTETFKDWPRFDGAAAWAGLTAEQQAEIGPIAIELVVAWIGEDACEGEEFALEARPFAAADRMLSAMLFLIVAYQLRQGDLLPALRTGPCCCQSHLPSAGLQTLRL